MKYFLFAIALLFSAPAFAATNGGISPCTIAAQPGDLAVSGTSANFKINTCGETLIVINNTASDIRFRLGSASTTTALTTDLLIPKATSLTLNVGRGGLYFAAVSAGTGSISFILGTAGN